jgi:hypothetical protein
MQLILNLGLKFIFLSLKFFFTPADITDDKG